MLNNEIAPAQVRGLDEGKKLNSDTDQIALDLSAVNNTADAQRALFTIFTSTTPPRLSKGFERDGDGKYTKIPGGQMAAGTAKRAEASGPQELQRILEALTPDQAIGFGITGETDARIGVQRNLAEGEIARTKEYFDFPDSPAILPFDYDPRKGGGDPLLPLPLLDIYRTVAPELANTPMAVAPSVSSHIYTDAGECLKGAGGQRVYVFVKDGRDIPRAGRVMHDRLWLAGHGYYEVTKSGQAREKSLVDVAVYSPERLDFSGPAVLGRGLVQRKPPIKLLNQGKPFLDTREAFPDLNPEEKEQLARLKARAREEVRPQCEEAKNNWIKERLAEFKATRDGLSEQDIQAAEKKWRRAVEEGVLHGDFVLYFPDGSSATVRDVMADPVRRHDTRCADPLEPDYNDDPDVAWVCVRAGCRPFIFSHAHGGRKYILTRTMRTLRVMGGRKPEMVAECNDVLALCGEVYQRGGELVRCVDGGLLPVAEHWLMTHLEESIRFEAFKYNDWRSVDCPPDLVKRVRADVGGWIVPELRSVIRGPILRPDGSILDQPGYDAATGLLFAVNGAAQWPNVPTKPTRDQVRAALCSILDPFTQYRLKSPLDWGVLLSALLTTIQRPLLPQSPAFAANAHAAGSGKTKMMRAVAHLDGKIAIPSAWPKDVEEQRKALLAQLAAGAGAILIDNIEGSLESEVLCSVLTSEVFKGRRLGVSEELTVPTRAMVLMTGNNIALLGDLTRRVLMITVDHGLERPDLKAFPFDPVARASERWRENRAAGLTILRGFLEAGAPKPGQSAFGSYEAWDALIRGAVVWVAKEGLSHIELADPLACVEANLSQDRHTLRLRTLLAAWERCFGDKPVRARDLENMASASSFTNIGGHHDPADIGTVLQEIAGQHGRLNVRLLGAYLEKHQGRIVDGRSITRGRLKDGIVTWVLRVEL